MIHLMRCVFLSLMLALVWPSSAVAAQWPHSGEIVYEVLRGEGGMKLGEGTHRWLRDGDRYEMSVQLETTGLAAVFVDFHYTQRSHGRVTADGFVPELFTVDQRGRERESASFDWEAGSVLIQRRRGRQESFELEAGDIDVLSAWHLAGLRDGKLPGSLSLVSNRNVAEADVTVVGRESITLPLGRLDALHVRLRARSGKLAIDLWLSVKHGLVPVRVLMQDDKGQVVDQRAIELKVDGMPKLAARG